MDSTDVPKLTMTPPSPLLLFIFITLLDFFVITLTTRLFDADYVIFQCTFMCLALKKKKRKKKGKKNF